MNEATLTPSTPYQGGILNQFTRRILERASADINCGWEDILIPQGLALCAQSYDDSEMWDWVRNWIDYQLTIPYIEEDQVYAHLRKEGFVFNDYCGNWGAPMVLAPLYQRTEDARYLELIEKTCDTIINKSTRLKKNVIAHGGFGKTTVWVDTLYYTATPLVMAYQVTKNERYAKEAVEQCLLHSHYLRDTTTGCYFHDANPENQQRTNWFWARGNGWIIMALADTLRGLPSDTEGWDEILAHYLSLCTGLLRLQHPCGMWRIVPEDDSSHLETSGTAMILTGLAIGITEKWLEPTVTAQLMRGYHELKTWINPRDGALTGSQKPAGHGGWETHKRSVMAECTYASGIFLRLLAELKNIDEV